MSTSASIATAFSASHTISCVRVVTTGRSVSAAVTFSNCFDATKASASARDLKRRRFHFPFSFQPCTMKGVQRQPPLSSATSRMDNTPTASCPVRRSAPATGYASEFRFRILMPAGHALKEEDSSYIVPG